MQDEHGLSKQPRVRAILNKRISKRRNGRRDIEYFVEFADFSKEEAAWYAAKHVRNRYSTAYSGASIFRAEATANIIP